MGIRSNLALALLVACFAVNSPCLLTAQDPAPRYEVGVVYYLDGADFKPLDKEPAPQSGRSNYAAKIKGPHARIRLRVGQRHVFRVCGIDPTRYRLYSLRSEKSARTITIAKINAWIGGSKTVLSQSEVPVAIEDAKNGCFALTPKAALADGEFAFSPVESMDAFTFGVGEVPQSK